MVLREISSKRFEAKLSSRRRRRRGKRRKIKREIVSGASSCDKPVFSSSKRLDILFPSFFSLVPPFFYTIVVRTGSSKRGGEKKRMTESIIRFGGENEEKREKSGIDAVSFRENRKVRSKSPY